MLGAGPLGGGGELGLGLAQLLVDTDGQPVFVGLGTAASESGAWGGFRTDLGAQGLRCPLLVISQRRRDRTDQRRRAHHVRGLFKEAAQRWAITRSLQGMKRCGTARRVGAGPEARWFAGRSPRVPGSRRSLIPFNPVKSREVLTTTTRTHVDRELVKADLLAVLEDKRGKGKTRDLVQSAYNRLCGRS